MNEAISVALIGLAGSAIGTFGGILASSKLTQYRLQQLEKKVEAHNQLIDRTYRLEAHEEVMNTEIEDIRHSINKLEKYHNG